MLAHRVELRPKCQSQSLVLGQESCKVEDVTVLKESRIVLDGFLCDLKVDRRCQGYHDLSLDDLSNGFHEVSGSWGEVVVRTWCVAGEEFFY
jgi:hypothetical protein